MKNYSQPPKSQTDKHNTLTLTHTRHNKLIINKHKNTTPPIVIC